MKKRCTNVFLMISILFLSFLLFPEKGSAASTTVYGGVDYSPVYNYGYYTAHNPDVANAFHGDASATLKHFVNHGMSEGRRASESFDEHSYFLAYPDLRSAFGTDKKSYYLHYINSGRREGRTAVGTTQLVGRISSLKGSDYSAVYNYQYYVDHNPDVAKHFGEDDVAILDHFINCGMSEGRKASESFDVHSYYLRYPDLRRAFGKNRAAYYIHYINHGRREGRTATGVTQMQGAVTSLGGINYSSVYNYQYYVDHNPDVARYYGDDDLGVLNHFVNCGMSEGRKASESFDVHSYYLTYPDLRRAFGKNRAAYYMHYINHGRREGRTATGVTQMQGAVTSLGGINYSSVYNYQYYVDHNPDVARYYGDDDLGVLNHFVNCGMSESRQASAEFNVLIYRSNYPDLQNAFKNNMKDYYLHYIKHGKSEHRIAATPKTGWWVIDGKKFYYENGKYCTGLKTIGGKNYYFSSAGVLSSEFGIDVSSHQGQIDWAKVKNDGVEFAMIRIGWGSEDKTQDDDYGARNMAECKRLGIPYGVYLFSYAMDETDAASEAQHILRLLNGNHPPLGVYLDVENNTYWSKDLDESDEITKIRFDPYKNSTQVNKNVKIVMDTLKNKGYSGQTGIYANPDFLRNVLDANLLTNNKLWLANWNPNSLPDYSFVMWQYSDGQGLSTIDGISGNIDHDLLLLNS